MGAVIWFQVDGRPRPQGSACWRPTRNGKVARIPDRASEHWRERVAAAAERAMAEQQLEPLAGPVTVSIGFRIPRPACHYGTGRNAGRLKAGAPQHPIGPPDLDKLERAILDGLTSTALRDDSQVVELRACKVFAPPELGGVDVRVEEVEP